MHNWYIMTFRLKSWTASEWQSDTIFGHLCWAIRYTDGEDSLLEFLDAFRQGRPPILLSNGFPSGLFPCHRALPRHINTPSTLKLQRELAQQEKEIRRVSYLTLEEFNRAINGEVFLPTKKGNPFQRNTLKTQIDRHTGTTGDEGRLFDLAEAFCPEISVYARIEDFFLPRVESLFSYIVKGGYGKRKSVGYGAISDMNFAPLEGLRLPRDANGFVTMSNFVPAQHDPTVGFWSILVKYGKLGEEYAIGGSPLKYPLVMLVAGSTFYDSPVKPFYGRMVADVSSAYPKVVQYGFALPIPARLPVL